MRSPFRTNTRRVLLIPVVAVLIAAATAAGSFAAPTRSTSSKATSFANTALVYINAARRGHGLAGLRLDGVLARAAAAHTHSMARNGFFSHDSLDGTPPGERIRRYVHASEVGETLLWRSPDCTPAQAVAMWLASPEHRAVLLSHSLRRIGLAALHVTRAPGVYGARAVTILTADFAS